MTLAITIATYQRADGQTPYFLRRALDSVFAQTDQAFKVFCVGDKYEDALEFYGIVTDYPAEKLWFVNLPVACERDKYAGNPEQIWCSGGTAATNVAIDQALALGCSWICRLDHDDQWLPHHLETIRRAITETGGAWFCTRSVCATGSLPNIKPQGRYTPFLPKPGGLFHSSTGYNARLIPLRGRVVADTPTDYDLWQRMAAYIREAGLKSYFIDAETCVYNDGLYERTKHA